MLWISPARRRGAFRYQASFGKDTVRRLISPLGKTGGAPIKDEGLKESASCWSRFPNWLKVANDPLVITDRPRLPPEARQSVHATV